MFGSKLRSWMEAVRPRKKQHRKDKQNKPPINQPNSISTTTNWQNTTNFRSQKEQLHHVGDTNRILQQNQPTVTTASSSRYSANNLSSPESAYSTGYSTDGTSPGAPPDYYANMRTGTKYLPTKIPEQKDEPQRPKQTTPVTVIVHQNLQALDTSRTVPIAPNRPVTQAISPLPAVRLNEVIGSPILTSPRQRNRIRTNPWLPGNTLSPAPVRNVTPAVTRPVTDSPRFCSPAAVRRNPALQKQSLSSSSCSSLSAASVHWGSRKLFSESEEDDCTLNEMMGKYDESYVYEKETDILSDSDPTDCDTDIDTGQDGGDEDDPLECDIDFIDNGSYIDLDTKQERNTGHCSYYNFDSQRKTSRRRTARRSKQTSEKQRRSTSNKKRHKKDQSAPVSQVTNGSKSAGATPLAVRRSQHHPVSKLALNECLKKRSNSVSFTWEPITTIDKSDKEADRKYKELIGEAELILKNMKTNALSPRRVPGPPNKRVELLRSAEGANKQELIYAKNRLIEETGQHITKIPSNNFNCPRFSPKKNHITNFMINNSPVLMRRECELRPKSPLVTIRRNEVAINAKAGSRQEVNAKRPSPKYRKKAIKPKQQDFSSSSDEDVRTRFGCPQSEPVRRKVYFQRGKTVAFNLHDETFCSNAPLSKQFEEDYKVSAENLRQQNLLNTITNLKRNLEDQSASLKQVYRSSQNLHLF